MDVILNNLDIFVWKQGRQLYNDIKCKSVKPKFIIDCYAFNINSTLYILSTSD